jgi:hypothetical protein
VRGIHGGKIRNTCDDAAIVFDGEGNGAVGASEGAEVEGQAVDPEGGVLRIVGERGSACYPSALVNAIAGAEGSAERAQVSDGVVRMVRWLLILCEWIETAPPVLCIRIGR